MIIKVDFSSWKKVIVSNFNLFSNGKRDLITQLSILLTYKFFSFHVTQGEIEQLTISRESSAVSKQCASSRIPITTGKNDDFDHGDDDMFEMQGDDPDVYLHTSRKKNIGMYFVIQICYFGFWK